jgi:hypothetical protein
MTRLKRERRPTAPGVILKEMRLRGQVLLGQQNGVSS